MQYDPHLKVLQITEVQNYTKNLWCREKKNMAPGESVTRGAATAAGQAQHCSVVLVVFIVPVHLLQMITA